LREIVEKGRRHNNLNLESLFFCGRTLVGFMKELGSSSIEKV